MTISRSLAATISIKSCSPFYELNVMTEYALIMPVITPQGLQAAWAKDYAKYRLTHPVQEDEWTTVAGAHIEDELLVAERFRDLTAQTLVDTEASMQWTLAARVWYHDVYNQYRTYFGS